MIQDCRIYASTRQARRARAWGKSAAGGMALALAACALGTPTLAAAATATPATFAKALAGAHPGDTIALSGAFEDLYISGRSFSPALTLTCADPAHPASVRSLHIKGATGVHLNCIGVAFKPDDKTTSSSAAVTIDGSGDIALSGMKIIGGPAVNGVAETAETGDRTGNVIGWPTGRGVMISFSHDVSLTDSEVAFFHRGMVLSTVSNVTVRHNDFHDRRTTAIVGANLTDVKIDQNIIRAAAPWRWGQTPVGDHSDCLAFWSDAKQTTPNARVSVTNNRMEQTSGATVMGMWFSGSPEAPFTDINISGNTFVIPNLQGILLTNAVGGVVENNYLVQSPVAGVDPKQRPTIMLRNGVTGVAVKSNHVSAPIVDKSGGTNTVAGNVVMTGNVKIPPRNEG